MTMTQIKTCPEPDIWERQLEMSRNSCLVPPRFLRHCPDAPLTKFWRLDYTPDALIQALIARIEASTNSSKPVYAAALC